MRRWGTGPLILGLWSCAGPAWQQTPHDLRFQRSPTPIAHPKPEANFPAEWWYAVEQTTTRPLGRALSPIHWIDKATHGPPARDINHFGEVIDSTWFQNRLGRRDMTVEEVARGPNTLEGPASGRLLVLSGKLSGASAGLEIQDREGHTFLVKFDPPAYPGLASSAEVVATKILYAAGYNVPENYVRRFSTKDLTLKEGAVGPAKHGQRQAMTQESLDALMRHANPTLGGQVQALFSRIIEGQPVGPFDYQGLRRDDPNDTIPHERRRSLRAYRWFCAWVNNTDARASNSLDVFRQTSDGEGYLVHYLLDFGNALGSLGTKQKYPSDGYDPVLSWSVLGELFFTAGLRYRYWLPVQRSPFRSVGIFEADVFDPRRWSPSIPNPAFEASTPLDAFWAASIMAHFSRPMIEGIVRSAAYRNPNAERYVVDVLWARRAKILQMAFHSVSPLTDAEVSGSSVTFRDLAVQERFESSVKYHYALRWHGDGKVLRQGTTDQPRFELPRAEVDSNPFFSLEVRREIEGQVGPRLQLHLRAQADRFFAVGLERAVR